MLKALLHSGSLTATWPVALRSLQRSPGPMGSLTSPAGQTARTPGGQLSAVPLLVCDGENKGQRIASLFVYKNSHHRKVLGPVRDFYRERTGREVLGLEVFRA